MDKSYAFLWGTHHQQLNYRPTTKVKLTTTSITMRDNLIISSDLHITSVSRCERSITIGIDPVRHSGIDGQRTSLCDRETKDAEPNVLSRLLTICMQVNKIEYVLTSCGNKRKKMSSMAAQGIWVWRSHNVIRFAHTAKVYITINIISETLPGLTMWVNRPKLLGQMNDGLKYFIKIKGIIARSDW